MLQDLCVVDQRLEVIVIELRQQGVYEFPSFLAAADDQLYIVWRNDYAGITAKVFGESCIELIVHRKFLFTRFPQDTNRFFPFVIEQKFTLQAKTFMPLVDIQLVLPGKITFGETEIMDRIQQVGLAYAISSANANDPLREGEVLVEIIFELEN